MFRPVLIEFYMLKTFALSLDPFVKVYLLQDGRKISKKKTSTKRDDTNPIFNEAMIFSVPSIVLQVTPQTSSLQAASSYQAALSTDLEIVIDHLIIIHPRGTGMAVQVSLYLIIVAWRLILWGLNVKVSVKPSSFGWNTVCMTCVFRPCVVQIEYSPGSAT